MPIFVTNNSFLPAPAKRVRRAGEGSSGETSRLPLLLSGGTGISNQPWARQGARSVRVSRWRGPCKCEFMVVGLARCIWLAPISRSVRPLFPSAFREIKALRPRRLYVSRVLPLLAVAARLSPTPCGPCAAGAEEHLQLRLGHARFRRHPRQELLTATPPRPAPAPAAAPSCRPRLCPPGTLRGRTGQAARPTGPLGRTLLAGATDIPFDCPGSQSLWLRACQGPGFPCVAANLPTPGSTDDPRRHARERKAGPASARAGRCGRRCWVCSAAVEEPHTKGTAAAIRPPRITEAVPSREVRGSMRTVTGPAHTATAPATARLLVFAAQGAALRPARTLRPGPASAAATTSMAREATGPEPARADDRDGYCSAALTGSLARDSGWQQPGAAFGKASLKLAHSAGSGLPLYFQVQGRPDRTGPVRVVPALAAALRLPATRDS